MQETPSVAAQLKAAGQRSPLLLRPGFLIRRLHQIHCALFQEETRVFQITPVQYSLLTTLAEHGEFDLMGLAAEIGLERTSVSDVIARLEERGLAQRRQDPADKRVKRVKITRKGRTLLKKIDTAAHRAHARTIEALPAQERDQLLLLMVRLVEANNDLGAVPFRLR